MNPELAHRIVSENLKVHELEATIYDGVHPELFNLYEQRNIWRLLRFASRAISQQGTRRALDVGAGTGNVTLKLLDIGYQVTALDISPAMIARLKGKVGGQCELICKPVDDYLASSPKEQFDLITISSVLHHLPFYTETLKQCIRLLVPGGAIVIMHEPLSGYSKKTDPVWVRALSAFSNRLSLRLARQSSANVYIDYTYSDYHASSGISPDDLVAEFERFACNAKLVQRHRVERSSWAAFLNGRVLGGKSNNFNIVAVKSGGGGGSQEKECSTL